MTWRFMLTAGVLSAQLTLLGEEKLPETVQFNRDIRPLLSNNCFLCHGPDEGRRKAKLRLDVEDPVSSSQRALFEAHLGK